MGGVVGKNPEYKGDNLVRTVLSILVDVSSVGFAGEGVKKALLNKALSTLIKSTGDVTAADVLEVVVIVHASFLVNNAVWDAAKGAEHLGYKCEQTEVAFVAGDVTGVTPGKNVRPWTASVVSPGDFLRTNLDAVAEKINAARRAGRSSVKIPSGIRKNLAGSRFWSAPGARSRVWAELAHVGTDAHPDAIRSVIYRTLHRPSFKPAVVHAIHVDGPSDDWIFNKIQTAPRPRDTRAGAATQC
jgi:hypothetical protein